jgi:class 3 adenylate cyclase
VESGVAHAPVDRGAAVGIGGALALPLALLILLRAAPPMDGHWENNPVHFWIVFVAGAISAALALAVTDAGRRRRDARLCLIGVAFLCSAGFLALHALATPGVLLDHKNAGFVLATPVGLIGAGIFAGLSAGEYRLTTSLRIVRAVPWLVALVLAAMGVWAGVSIADLPPLKQALTPDQVTAPLGAVAAIGVIAYAFAAYAYFNVWRRRRTRLALGVAFAFALLAEALVVAIASLVTSWKISWWEWHALMALGFVCIATAVWSEWHEERFSGIYLEETLAGHREVSVLFADLAGFTPFSEQHAPDDVYAMLVEYFAALTPLIADEYGGEVHEFVGDQIFAIWNKGGDQPDHAVRAARAALALQEAAESIRARHADWPRFRAGVNTGPVLAGVVGGRGHRVHGVFGDTVNLGARLESNAPVGGVLVGASTHAALPAGTEAERVDDLHVKGKADVVEAYVLHSVAGVLRADAE